MATYRYQCVKCENFISFTPIDKPDPKCCEAEMVKVSAERIFTPSGSARRRWCNGWTPDSKSFKFGDWRDKTEVAEEALFSERHNLKQGVNNAKNN